MSKKLVHGFVLMALSGLAVTAVAEPPLPAVPSASTLFPQAKTPQSRLTLEMLPKLQRQILPKPMAASIKLSDHEAKQKLYVRHFIFTGSTVYSDRKLSRIAGLENQSTTLGQLHAALNRITAYYRKKGYILGRAYLPVQNIHDGNVTVMIVEGDINDIVLTNKSTVLTSKVRAILDSHLKIGKPLNNDAANRAIMILKELPGVGDATANLQPGRIPGSVTVLITVSPGKNVSGNIGANNYGTRFSGKYQAFTAVNINDITHHGDQIGLQGGVSKNDLMDNGRVFWEVPIGNDGLRTGFSLTESRYEVGDSLSSLGAHGTSKAATIYGHYPLYLSPLSQVNFDYSFDHRWLEDDTDSAGTSFHKKINAVVLTLMGNKADTVFRTIAVNTWSIANTVGTLEIEDPGQLSIDETTAKTNGQYDKMAFLLSRQQVLTKQWSLYLSGNGQWSNKNLDASERFSMGGPNAVRAYPTGEAGGDEGMYGTIELRDQLRKWLRLAFFYDEGKVWFNKNAYILNQNNTRVIAGPGIGADISYKKFTLNASLAVRNTGRSLSDNDDRPRFWLQAQYDF